MIFGHTDDQTKCRMVRITIPTCCHVWGIFLTAHMVFGSPVSRFLVSSDKLVELSHTFDRNTVYWPTIPANSTFRLSVLHEEINEDGTAYRDKHFAGAEHGGTHMDAPSHFSRDGYCIEISRIIFFTTLLNIDIS